MLPLTGDSAYPLLDLYALSIEEQALELFMAELEVAAESEGRRGLPSWWIEGDPTGGQAISQADAGCGPPILCYRTGMAHLSWNSTQGLAGSPSR